jgi:hypothetical protein
MKQIEIGKTLAKTLISIAVCIAGAVSMWASGGETGIGWAILGLVILWGL